VIHTEHKRRAASLVRGPHRRPRIGVKCARLDHPRAAVMVRQLEPQDDSQRAWLPPGSTSAVTGVPAPWYRLAQAGPTKLASPAAAPTPRIGSAAPDHAVVKGGRTSPPLGPDLWLSLNAAPRTCGNKELIRPF
jgi:hypothetical protein